MLRHIKHIHCAGKFNEVNSSNLFDSSDESSNDKPEVEMSDNEETVDPWFEMIEHAYNVMQSDFNTRAKELLTQGDWSEKNARTKTFEELLPKYRKKLIDTYLYRVLWLESLENDPIHAAIEKMVQRLVAEYDYEREEAWKYATNKRRYLFDKLFNDYQCPKVLEGLY